MPRTAKPLSEVQRIRFARHLLLPEIGLDGQERLCAAAITIADGCQESVRRLATAYLERSGVEVVAKRKATPQCGVERRASGPGESPVNAHVITLPTSSAVARLAGTPHLAEAAAALAGAFAAVEAIKTIVGAGVTGNLSPELSLHTTPTIEEREP